MPAFAPRSWGIPPETNPGVSRASLPVEVTGLGYEIRKERSYRWTQALHPEESGWVIQYTLSGRGRFSSGTCEPVLLGKGELFFTCPGLAYEYAWAGHEPWEFLWIMVRGDWAGRFLTCLAGELSGRPILDGDGTAEVAGLLEGLLLRLDQGIPVDRRRLSLMAYELLLALDAGVQNTRAAGSVADGSHGSADRVGQSRQARQVEQTRQPHAPGDSRQAGDSVLARNPPGPGLSSPTAAKARIWLARHMDCQGYAEMATHFGYHPKYFIPWFRRRTGITPEKFIRDEKLRHACRLLEGTSMQVKAMAAELGFREDNHFSRVFRQATGMSPQAWRTRRQSGQIYDGILVL